MTDHYFDSKSEVWSSLYRSDPDFIHRYSRLTAFLDGALEGHPTGVALDVGCGTAVFSTYLAARGWRLLALDPSPSMIEAGRRHARAELMDESERVNFRVSTLEDFEPGDDEFDLVICFSVLEYIDDDDAAIRALSGLVKPGGLLVLTVPNRRGATRKLEKLYQAVAKLIASRESYLKLQRHQYAVDRLDRCIEGEGFRKSDSMLFHAHVKRPRIVVRLFEREWWAAMYAACYRRVR
jgi:2-polyprenyl-3-methyl-5-hydroxy-6-metoxy-1,4-benzoquinol methylase